MKGDFTRLTFKPQQHYSSVRMQQGRVQLDSDWNEQLDITAHRIETESGDTLGPCAAPLHAAAFGIVTDPTTLPPEEQARLTALGQIPLAAGDFLLTAGRFYADGILVENELTVPFSAQPDQFGVAPIAGAGTYLAYLDVWQRHLTALEAPDIREVALGGPDTATRTRTIWQVKLLPVASGTNCLSDLEDWQTLLAGSSGQLAARARPEEAASGPCIVPPSSGYRGLQNQLYRVEIHQPGNVNAATYKWSRENGSLVFAIEEFVGNQPTAELRLRSLGRDDELGLHPGDWVEVLDDENEAAFTPGTLARILEVDEGDLVITLSQNVTGFDLERHPKVRRWDSAGELAVAIPPANGGWLALEEGVEIHFSAGSFHTGDYWLIPARTILGNPTLTQTGGIEWPADALGDPLAISPQGILHHYCRLAVLAFDETGLTVTDCRPLFPPLTELVQIQAAGGDGQEALPGDLLPQPIEVGVSNGQWPVEGAGVRFRIALGNGVLTQGAQSGADITVATQANGVASVLWRLDNSNHSQRVEVSLLDAAGDALHLPVYFNANTSVASQVGYDTNCRGLEGANTVQEALDALCANSALRYVGGDGQSVVRNPTGGPTRLPFPLEVRLANGDWPAPNEAVIFRIEPPGGGQLSGGGQTGNQVQVTTDANGYAACEWELDNQNPAQQVIAFWEPRPDLFIHFNGFLDLGGRQQPGDDPAIHIVEVLIAGQPLEHGSTHPVAALKEGIIFQLDDTVSPEILKEDDLFCAVTLEVPFPMNPMDQEFYGQELVGFEPLRLNARLALANDRKAIRWVMVPNVENFLFQLLSRIAQLNFGQSVTARLTLRGNFVYGQGDPLLHVDADSFAVPGAVSPLGIAFPSGDGKRGGLFETWFRIVEG